MDNITLNIKAKRWIDHAPMRLRQELASGESNGKEFSISVCASGAAIYFMAGEAQISMPIRGFAKACLNQI